MTLFTVHIRGRFVQISRHPRNRIELYLTHRNATMQKSAKPRCKAIRTENSVKLEVWFVREACRWTLDRHANHGTPISCRRLSYNIYFARILLN